MHRSILLSTLAILASPALAAPRYNITSLPGASTSISSFAYDFSSAGIAGATITTTADGSLASIPILWKHGQTAALPLPANYEGSAIAIDQAGDIAGIIRDMSWRAPSLPVLWQNGNLQFLNLADMAAGTVLGMNDSGITVGEIHNLDANGYSIQQTAAFWIGGQPTTIQGFYQATAANDVGQFLLESPAGSFVWTNGVAAPIPSLGGTYAMGRDINNLGHVAGCALTSDHMLHAFLFKNGTTTALADLPGSTGTTLVDGMNNADDVVGSSYHLDEGPHAVLWKNGIPYDLNDLIPPASGWTLYDAMGIDDNGTIWGSGQFDGGDPQAFLLTPIDPQSIPEPASLSLLSLSILPLLLRRVASAPRGA
jgi:probable HAF family extracellular repeat protein